MNYSLINFEYKPKVLNIKDFVSLKITLNFTQKPSLIQVTPKPAKAALNIAKMKIAAKSVLLKTVNQTTVTTMKTTKKRNVHHLV